MSETDSSEERRQYPRIKAPIYCRPAHRRLPRRQVVDLGLGGIRVYSDDPFAIGTRLEVELFLPDETTLTCLTEVVWVSELEADSPARYDVGLQFLDAPPEQVTVLEKLLSETK